MCGVCLAPFSIALTLAPCSHTCRSRIPFLNISCFIDSLTDGWMDGWMDGFVLLGCRLFTVYSSIALVQERVSDM